MIDELSIVIPALNEEGYLPFLLQSIADQEFDGKLEILVVDGYSTDNTVAVAEGFAAELQDLTVVRCPANIGAQRNFGASLAKYRYLLFVDSDVIMPLGTLSRLSRDTTSAAPFVGAVVHTGPNMGAVDYVALLVTYSLLIVARLLGKPVTNGDFVLTTKETHEQIARGFVEGAVLGEDTDYGLRCTAGGARYRFYRHVWIIASDRRVREMGRIRLVRLWSHAFIRVIRHGPIFPSEDLHYPYGHYGSSPDVNRRGDL